MDVSPTVNGATNFGAKCFGFTAEYQPPRVNWGDPKNLRDKAQIRLKSHFDEIPIFEYNCNFHCFFFSFKSTCKYQGILDACVLRVLYLTMLNFL